MTMEFHEISSLFPLMEGAEFSAFVEDIRANGQREPIWTYDGKIIDGRNRYRACQEIGIQPLCTEWEGSGSLVSFVVSLNLHRRHLNESQRGMVHGRIATLPKGVRSDTAIAVSIPTQQQAAEMLNVSIDTGQRARRVIEHGAPELVAVVESGRVSVSAAADISELPRKEQREVVARGEKEILEKAREIRQQKTEARREQRVEKIVEQAKNNQPLISPSRYPVLYCDPPWKYDFMSVDAWRVENHYPTMEVEEICALPVADLSTDDAILFLWATAPKLAEAMKVIPAWGFQYKTCAIWDKEWTGMGNYFRVQHELLLIATRGNIPPPTTDNRPASIYREKRSTKHSEKPKAFYEIIEAMYPELPKVELFARSARKGWGAWGFEVESSI